MKKNIIPLILALLVIAAMVASIIITNKQKGKDNYKENVEIYTPSEEKIEIEEKEPEYKDDNNVPISLYIEQGDELVKITEYSCDWSPENVLNLFYAIPSEEDSISSYNFDSMWKEKIAAYPNGDKCRIGYQVSFKYNDGQTYTYNLKCPDDTYFTFPKVMTYLYDDVNLVPGKAYYHITQDVMYDYTIASSIKLVGDVDSDKIDGPITLTAFCFDSEDDFDEDGNYRGNSKYSITITRE